jgi:hypothetical protein
LAVVAGPCPAATSAEEVRHTLDTTLSSVSGLGAVQKLQSMAAPVTVPPAPATNEVNVTAVPGAASAGSARTARMRVEDTSESSGPRFGTHVTVATASATSTAGNAPRLTAPPSRRARR